MFRLSASSAAGCSVAMRRFSSTATAAVGGAVDVHTHCYLPRYMQMLRDRTEVPRVVRVQDQDRLVILPGEDTEGSTSAGRPIGTEYSSADRKLAYMDTHNIDISVLSLANPWLDFLPRAEAVEMATALNGDMEDVCASSGGRFYGFGVLPTQDIDASCRELERLAEQDHMRGIIFSTHGVGEGIDDRRLLPLFRTAADLGHMIFLHPHYGVGTEHFGGFGHALFLALGFTFETTTAVARLICSGMLDEVPHLKLLLAHTGGTLPFLAGRLDSCVKGDPHLQGTLKRAPSDYLRDMYYDSIAYHSPTLDCGISMVGGDRLMFGTDHPFFPPPDPSAPRGVVDGPALDTTPWPSTTINMDLLDHTPHGDAIRATNAYKVLNIKPLPTE